MAFVFFWLVFALFVAIGAAGRGRSGLGWFLLAAIISPLLAAFLLIALPSKSATVVVVEEERGRTKTCPYCAEKILDAAIVCRYCGRDLAPGAGPGSDQATPRLDRAAAAQFNWGDEPPTVKKPASQRDPQVVNRRGK